MRKIIAIALLCILPLSAGAMEKRDTIDVSIDELLMTDAYLDTVNVKKTFILNDYTMIGVQYGVGINQMSFNPSKRQSHLITPRHFGIVLTTYGKIFGFMPYFGLETGVFYGQDGYKFKPDPEDGTYPYNVDHAVECVYDYVEVPFMSQFHIDQEHFKVMISAGMYGGWRYKVHRTWEEGYDYVNYTDNFYDHDIKLDYGLKFGAGFGLVFSPVEIHLKGQLRYGYTSGIISARTITGTPSLWISRFPLAPISILERGPERQGKCSSKRPTTWYIIPRTQKTANNGNSYC